MTYHCAIKPTAMRPTNTTDTGRDFRTGGIYTYATPTERDFDKSNTPIVATLQATAHINGNNYGSFRWTDGMVTIDLLADMAPVHVAFKDDPEMLAAVTA